jgi:UDP-GlcNAc:undecaprenyl-phosphate GlcNAc-1-phosphate transferase
MTIHLAYYLASALAGCLTVLVSFPLWQKWCLRIGLVDEPGGRKIHDKPIVLSGGLAVMSGILLPLIAAAAMLYFNSDTHSGQLLRYGLNRRSGQLIGILLGGLGMVLLGVLDDKHELPAGAKFAGQLLVAALVASTGVRITLFVPSAFFSYGITVLWLLTVINAFNFMDNMNGLCTGLGVIGAWHFAILAAAGDQYLVALIAFLAFGALLGFLPFNFPNATAFLGDAGSHLAGYILAVLAILPHFYSTHHPRRTAVLTPLLVLAVPLLDLVWVVILRVKKGQPFYQGDTNHLSHRLVRLGLSPTRAVLLIWLGAALCGAAACLW